MGMTPSGQSRLDIETHKIPAHSLELGRLVRGFTDSVTRSLATVAKTTTNLANAQDSMKLRLLDALREVVREIRSLKRDFLDEYCRGRKEDRALLQENQRELQSLRALIICAFDQEEQN